MKAFEARMETARLQYEETMNEIEKAIKEKKPSVPIGCISYPEVVERIAKEGYDVKIVHRALESYNEVSWEHAEEGREGTITQVDGTKEKISLDAKCLEILFGGED